MLSASLKLLALLAASSSFTRRAAAGLTWASVTSQDSLQYGDGTYYGHGGADDAQGACSYSGNFANTNALPWSSGTEATVALNDAQWDNGAACGMCILYRGTGQGIGLTPFASDWKRGFVNNRCPECAFGDVDVNKAGNGRWKLQWYAVPCNVGATSLQYNIVVSSYYWFSLVVSNTKIPVKSVSVKINGNWLVLSRSSNNQWPYYNTNGPWQSSFPMGIRITSIAGETVEDVLTSQTSTSGKVQFGDMGGANPAQAALPSGATAPSSSSSGSSNTSPSPQTPPSPSSPSPSSGSGSSDSSSGSSGVKFYIADYGQCGGTVAACGGASTPCIASQWPLAQCKSVGWSCNLYGDGFYQCQPHKSSSSSPGTVSSASLAAGGRKLLA